MRQIDFADNAARLSVPPISSQSKPSVPESRTNVAPDNAAPDEDKNPKMVDIDPKRESVVNTEAKLQNDAVADEKTVTDPVSEGKPSADVPVNEKPAIQATEEEKRLALFKEKRGKYAAEKMSVVVLFHNEYDSLRTALHSWIDKGLVDNVDEVLFFVNGGTSEKYFTDRLPEISNVPAEKRRIVVQKENLKLGLAITKMVSLAKHEYVLLLEKDWALIENRETTKSRLIDSKVIVGSGIAHLIRHRHRFNPGVPLHALIMHQGREQSILRQQKNLMCYVHHWQKDPTLVYPGQGKMWRCGGAERGMQEKDVFCSTSEYCQWTNNPCVFKKKWFIDEVGNRFIREYHLERSKYGDSSPFLDFEYYTNWRSFAWTDKNFTVAVGEGLFSHAETEHRYFNTFWYAHYRLTADYEEVRNEYLRNETRLKKMGAHYDTSGPPPTPMLQRFPTEFARKYHYADTFKGNMPQQLAMVDKLYQEYKRNYRVTAEDWKKSGMQAANAKKQVPWRHYITRLHESAEKGEMMVPPKQPYEMSITLVTTLLDIGRHRLGEDAYKFKRDFAMYIDALKRWLEHDYPKVVYTTREIAEEALKTASPKAKLTTRFVYTTREELGSRWIGPDNYEKIQEIRKSKEWRGRAEWLRNSPQAGLADYNPLVMGKMFMLRDAARTNHWNTSHFVFLDAKHSCMDPANMNEKKDHILRAHMFGKFLLTYFDYSPAEEVHGFEYAPLNEFLNLRPNQRRQMIKVGRGGIFGGSEFVIEYITAMYDVAMTASLRMGLMGTEENIFSILMYQVPQYIDPFSNNWACFRNIERDHKCMNRKSQGYNCAIFDWMRNNV